MIGLARIIWQVDYLLERKNERFVTKKPLILEALVFRGYYLLLIITVGGSIEVDMVASLCSRTYLRAFA